MSPENWTRSEPSGEQPSTPPAATAAEPTREQVIAGLRATSEGGADLVQLLTPEGQRVHHPEFDLDVSADERGEGFLEDIGRTASHTPSMY